MMILVVGEIDIMEGWLVVWILLEDVSCEEESGCQMID